MTVNILTPIVGSNGIFVISEPYALAIPGTAIDSGVEAKVYTCIAVRRFTDITESTSDVKAAYYLPFIPTITDAEFKEQVDNNVSIVTLRSDDDKLYYVPDSYILSFPHALGHPYADSYLVFRLHTHSLELDLEPLVTELSELVRARVGILSTPIVMSTNSVIYLDETEHASYEDNRLNNVTNGASVFNDLNVRESEVALQATVITAMEIETDRLRGLLDDNSIPY